MPVQYCLKLTDEENEKWSKEAGKRGISLLKFVRGCVRDILGSNEPENSGYPTSPTEDIPTEPERDWLDEAFESFKK